MLKSLFISNYALIDDLKVEFHSGFSVVTGETGAGKSILLGALGLISGDRLDKTVLRDDQKKMIIEASFDVKGYQMASVFDALDLDYADETIIRREVNTSGKSRSFINDTPVRLHELKTITDQLIHIHGQHQTHTILQPKEQLQFIDDFLKDKTVKVAFIEAYEVFQSKAKALQTFRNQLQEAQSKKEYLAFQCKDIEESGVLKEEQSIEEIEQHLEKIEHAEEILSLSNEIQFLFDNDEHGGIIQQLKSIQHNVDRMVRFDSDFSEIPERVKSVLIELEDLYQAIEQNSEVEYDANSADQLREKVNHYNALLQKYHVASIEELKTLYADIKEQLDQIDSGSGQLETLESELKKSEKEVLSKGQELTQARKQALEEIVSFVSKELPQLGMPSAQLAFELYESDISVTGIDQIQLQFSANKGGKLQPVEKVASGGELSRLMLVLQWLWAKHKSLPTVIFDEIDTGVSGNIAEAMANVMVNLGQHMQVITITHLPQVAAKGAHHYLVEKYEDQSQTFSKVKRLEKPERIDVLAQMLSGSEVTSEAKSNAEKLLA